jgi:hypothetical protein
MCTAFRAHQPSCVFNAWHGEVKSVYPVQILRILLPQNHTRYSIAANAQEQRPSSGGMYVVMSSMPALLAGWLLQPLLQQDTYTGMRSLRHSMS